MVHVRMFAVSATVLLTAGFVQSAPDFPDTLWMPVTFYDFHSDGSNPEFEPADHSAGLIKGMVGPTLDADRKPVLGVVPQTPTEARNRYVKYWFRPWQAGTYGIHAQGDETVAGYKCTSGCGNNLTAVIAYDGIKNVGHDTSFINIVIEDSLPFHHLGGGTYEFSSTGSNPFFWLDGRGYGDEGKKTQTGIPHNFSFTMEMHTKFRKKSGLVFYFSGDDDVWAFVNNQLAMDIGGIHVNWPDSIIIDDLPGLIDGEVYPFDLFFAERHTYGSNIRITTNIISTVTPHRKLR